MNAAPLPPAEKYLSDLLELARQNADPVLIRRAIAIGQIPTRGGWEPHAADAKAVAYADKISRRGLKN